MTTTDRVPGPAPMPLVGVSGNVVQFLANPIAYARSLQREYGPIARVVQTATGMVFTFSPEYNRQILSNSELFYNPDFFFFPVPENSAPTRLNSGIIMVNGARHRMQRRLIMPAFHRQAVAGFRDTMAEQTEQLLAKWQLGETRDLAADMKQLTLYIASLTLFGQQPSDDVNALGPMLGRWLSSLTDVGAVVFPHDMPGTPYRRVLRLADSLDAALREMIVRKRAEAGPARDVLSMLIQANDQDGETMSESELIGNASVIFTAGHETTAYTLAWALLLLDQHPQVAADLRDELHGLLRGDVPTIEQLGQLPLLDMVVKEVLRVLPAAPFSLRIAQDAFQLGPYQLPASTQVLTSSFMTHHSPELYQQADAFVPRRWETITPGPYTYLPFNSGPRMCIGATFAQTEMKVVLAMIFQRFRPTLAPGARVTYHASATIRPNRGLPMRLLPASATPVPEPVRGSIRELVAFAA